MAYHKHGQIGTTVRPQHVAALLNGEVTEMYDRMKFLLPSNPIHRYDIGSISSISILRLKLIQTPALQAVIADGIERIREECG